MVVTTRATRTLIIVTLLAGCVSAAPGHWVIHNAPNLTAHVNPVGNASACETSQMSGIGGACGGSSGGGGGGGCNGGSGVKDGGWDGGYNTFADAKISWTAHCGNTYYGVAYPDSYGPLAGGSCTGACSANVQHGCVGTCTTNVHSYVTVYWQSVQDSQSKVTLV